MNAHEYATRHHGRFLDQLCDLIRIPSVSTLSEYRADVRRAADWLVEDMRRIGFERAETYATEGHPVVYGEWLGAGPDAPTVLIYGHYDVQPAEIADGWDTKPFEPTIKQDRIYGRGSVDDKGQVFAQLKAVESLLAADEPCPVNIKFVIEGEEEVASENLTNFIDSHQPLLQADVCVISDTNVEQLDQPEIYYSLRGLVYMELHVYGPAVDMHSGFGGIIHNPAQALAEIISTMHDADGRITIPGFYDDVLELTPEERKQLNRYELPESEIKERYQINALWGEPGYTVLERLGARPTLEINGLVSGFYGEGSKTVLPAKAMAKLSSRIVANQKAQRVFELVREHVAAVTPPTIRSELRLLNLGEAAYTDPGHPAMQAAIEAYKQGWGAEPIFRRGGGTIPIIADFQNKLNLPVVLLGFGHGENAHGPNENFHLTAFERGIQTAIYFLEATGVRA